MTTIANLPVYGFDIPAQLNEDLRVYLAYVDDRVVGVTVYNGGSGYGGPSYTGTLPIYFSPPASGNGIPALGVANVVSSVISSIAVTYGGQGYAAQESLELTLPGDGEGLVAGVDIGNPLSLDGILIDFEARQLDRDGTTSPTVAIFASNQPAPGVVDGTITTSANTLSLSVLETSMFTKTAGNYQFEFRARADGAVRVIAKGAMPLTQGIAYERG